MEPGIRTVSGFLVRDRLVSEQTGPQVLLLQPRLDLVRRKPAAFEATAWRPRIGPAAPDGGDMLRDAVLLRQACRLVASCASSTQPVLSIGVSEAQIACGMLTELIADALADCQLPPARLELRFCEDCLFGDEAALLWLLADLRDLGVNVVLDGFGSQVSGLTLLRRRGLAGLLSGVRVRPFSSPGTCCRASDASVLRGMVSAARSLGLAVFAEGADNETDAALLSDIGCDQALGVWFGVALPARDVVRQLRD